MATDRPRPAELVEGLRGRIGPDALTEWAVGLLTGEIADDDPDHPDVTELGGRAGWPAHWAREWGARALRHAWDDRATPAVVAGLADEHWRVRRMCALVVAAHEVGEAVDALPPLLADEHPRVRAAAARACGEVADTDVAGPLRTLLTDPDPAVAQAAERALDRLAERLG